MRDRLGFSAADLPAALGLGLVGAIFCSSPLALLGGGEGSRSGDAALFLLAVREGRDGGFSDVAFLVAGLGATLEAGLAEAAREERLGSIMVATHKWKTTKTKKKLLCTGHVIHANVSITLK